MSRYKLFKAFKKVKCQKNIYEKHKYDEIKLIARKKQNLLINFSKGADKSKELLNTLKSLVIPKKTVASNLTAVDKNKTLESDITTMSKVFKSF